MKRIMGLGFLWIVMHSASAQQPMRGGPPPEALTACSSAQSGEACRFTAPHGTVSGVCRQMREPQLVCVPKDGPPGGRPPTQDRGGRRGMMPLPETVDIDREYAAAVSVKSRIPDTGQGSCFDNQGVIPCPAPGEPFYGQDAHYSGVRLGYRDNGDGTVTDPITGLTWQQAHHTKRLGWSSAKAQCESLNLGGHTDWRLPNIKELYSIADFAGATGRRPFLDPLFEIHEPDASLLEHDRFAATHHTDMMGQTWSVTRYTGDHWDRKGVEAAFFFNFLDGRIKQAPTAGRQGLFYRCVRGQEWGANRLQDNRNGTVTDQASGLMWQQQDDGKPRLWKDSLAYCENLSFGGYRDWRLPNAKELQSIVDYRYHDPAIDPAFFRQQDRKGWFWTSTTHGENTRQAIYLCFGKCISVDGVDVHGAGAQRSDPKSGDPARYSEGLGGQKDQVRIRNYARCVRSVE
ncbi:DUF1566 domain-containing protein [Sedimenticola sp.]|uniref:Lcl C-terminal domain-containing protein n=1 Tax=Sedimenticola sp. TaxID=1940285 RepID=UPI003D14A5E8